MPSSKRVEWLEIGDAKMMAKQFVSIQWCAKSPAPSLRAAESGVAIQTPNPICSPVIVFPQSGLPRRYAPRNDGGGD